jgi:hypothetical protein
VCGFASRQPTGEAVALRGGGNFLSGGRPKVVPSRYLVLNAFRLDGLRDYRPKIHSSCMYPTWRCKVPSGNTLLCTVGLRGNPALAECMLLRWPM